MRFSVFDGSLLGSSVMGRISIHPSIHTGAKSQQYWREILKEHGVESHSLFVTMDNASNKDTFV
jgi:hypothetical protein